jgi:hypothetical protein
MIKQPKINIVFDRRKKATSSIKSPLEIRVTYNSALGKTAEAVKYDLGDIIKLKPKSNAWQIGLTYYF